MKKVFIVFVSCVIASMFFAGCKNDIVIRTSETDKDSFVDNSKKESELKAFDELCIEIKTVEVATAGSSVKTALVSAKILKLVSGQSLTEKDYETELKGYIETLSEEEKANYKESLSAVKEEIQNMLDNWEMQAQILQMNDEYEEFAGFEPSKDKGQIVISAIEKIY